jgi:hypothetical protein
LLFFLCCFKSKGPSFCEFHFYVRMSLKDDLFSFFKQQLSVLLTQK